MFFYVKFDSSGKWPLTNNKIQTLLPFSLKNMWCYKVFILLPCFFIQQLRRWTMSWKSCQKVTPQFRRSESPMQSQPARFIPFWILYGNTIHIPHNFSWCAVWSARKKYYCRWVFIRPTVFSSTCICSMGDLDSGSN